MSLKPAPSPVFLRPTLCAIDAPQARRLAGGWARFDGVEAIGPGGRRDRLSLSEAEATAPAALAGLEAPRAPILGLSLDRPRVMGVLNATPDSFSDGGRHLAPTAAIEAGLAMIEAGADFLDVGGESTRPGSDPVDEGPELDRVLPVIEGLRAAAPQARISVDTRKAAVARAAFAAGARLFNDVSGLTHDAAAPAAAADLLTAHPDAAVCLTHAKGDPKSMQDDPRYEDVLFEVLAGLADRIAAAQAAGAPPQGLLVDPGIGFGKTLAHNLTLLRRLDALHGLGAPILLGVSRKRFIGAVSGEGVAARRGPGSLAAGIAGAARGAQILRVHDVAETVQALRVWSAIEDEEREGRG